MASVSVSGSVPSVTVAMIGSCSLGISIISRVRVRTEIGTFRS